jgi:hypothetical protein
MQMQQPRHKVQHQTLLAGDRLVALLLWPLPFMQRVWPLRFVAFADFGASSCDHCIVPSVFNLVLVFAYLSLSAFSPRGNRSESFVLL